MLFRPHGRVAEQVEALWQRHAQGKFVIVLQVRAGIGSDFTVFAEDEYDAGLTDFLSAAAAIEAAHVPLDTPVLWWLLTDRRAIRDRLQEKLERMQQLEDPGTRLLRRRRSLYWHAGEAVHMDKAIDAAEVERTFIEWFVVARAAAAVLTLESSFALSSWMMSYRGRPRPLHAVITPRRARLSGLESCRPASEAYLCGPTDVCMADDKGVSRPLYPCPMPERVSIRQGAARLAGLGAAATRPCAALLKCGVYAQRQLSAQPGRCSPCLAQ